MDYSNIYIVIPAFNEAKFIGRILEDISSVGFKNIILVDDGSKDDTNIVARRENVTILNHIINLGAGAATQTGITYALKKDAHIIVTIDGDGQHDVSDIIPMINVLLDEKADLVIGNRFKEKNAIPVAIRFYNWIGNLLTMGLTFHFIGDSQSGFKVMNRKCAEKLHLKFDGYEFCSDMIRQPISHNLKIREVPIKVYYHEEAKNKGQNIITGFLTALNLIFTHHPNKR